VLQGTEEGGWNSKSAHLKRKRTGAGEKKKTKKCNFPVSQDTRGGLLGNDDGTKIEREKFRGGQM